MPGKSQTRPTRERTTDQAESKPPEPPSAPDAGDEYDGPVTEDRTSGGVEQSVQTERPERKLSHDVAFDALQNSRRRAVIRYLRSRDGPVETGEIADHVAAREYDTTVEALASAQRKRVYVGLHQCHLPRLDEMGVVEFDRETSRASLGPAAPDLFSYLPDVDDESRPWGTYALGLAATSVAVLTGAMAAGVLRDPVEIGFAFAIVGALGVLAVAHAVDSRR